MTDTMSDANLATFRRLGAQGYVMQVIALFESPRATPAMWAALGYAVLHVSESSAGQLVAVIDREILRHLEAQEGAA